MVVTIRTILKVNQTATIRTIFTATTATAATTVAVAVGVVDVGVGVAAVVVAPNQTAAATQATQATTAVTSAATAALVAIRVVVVGVVVPKNQTVFCVNDDNGPKLKANPTVGTVMATQLIILNPTIWMKVNTHAHRVYTLCGECGDPKLSNILDAPYTMHRKTTNSPNVPNVPECNYWTMNWKMK